MVDKSGNKKQTHQPCFHKRHIFICNSASETSDGIHITKNGADLIINYLRMQ